MRTHLTVFSTFASILLVFTDPVAAQEKEEKGKPLVLEEFADFPDRGISPAGIVYGPKAAFKISAPKGWVVDNKAGVSQGMPCVLYPEDTTWAEADLVMYAKIASTNTTNRDAFVKVAIGHMSKDNENFKHERVTEGKTADGHAYIINDYRHGARKDAERSQFERVAYVQLPGAVAFIVFTVATEDLHKKHANSVQEVMKTFTYTPDFITAGVKSQPKKTQKKAPAKK